MRASVWFSCAEADECSSASASGAIVAGWTSYPLEARDHPLLRHALPQTKGLLVEPQTIGESPPLLPFCIALFSSG